MILTTCSACAKPIDHDASSRCAACETRYCSDRCERYDRRRGGHGKICGAIASGGGAEQYHADKKYEEAVADAVEECAEETEGQTCYICLEAGSGEGLVRGCSCRGGSGFAHVSCLAKQAKILVAEAEERDLDDDAFNARWGRWSTCRLCEQRYHGVVQCALSWACWKTYVGRPETDVVRGFAINQLGNGLSSGDHDEAALSVQEAELSMLRRVGAPELHILSVQGNLALTHGVLGNMEKALSMERDVYSGRSEHLGEEHRATLLAAGNYAVSLKCLEHFEEARSVLRKVMPVARRVLGENDSLTLKMGWTYGQVLYKDTDATLDDLNEAVTTLVDAGRIARRVFGGGHPLTEGIDRRLQEARDALYARGLP